MVQTAEKNNNIKMAGLVKNNNMAFDRKLVEEKKRSQEKSSTRRCVLFSVLLAFLFQIIIIMFILFA